MCLKLVLFDYFVRYGFFVNYFIILEFIKKEGYIELILLKTFYF